MNKIGKNSTVMELPFFWDKRENKLKSIGSIDREMHFYRGSGKLYREWDILEQMARTEGVNYLDMWNQ